MVLTQPAPVHHRWRWTGAVALLLVAALLTPPALVGFWGRRTVVDAQRYLDTVGPLAQSPEIQAAVAEEVTAELLSRVDVNAFLDREPAAGGRGPRTCDLGSGRELRRVVGAEVHGERRSSTGSGSSERPRSRRAWSRRSRATTPARSPCATGWSTSTSSVVAEAVRTGPRRSRADDLREGHDPRPGRPRGRAAHLAPARRRRRTSGRTPTPSRAGCCRSSSCSTSAPCCWHPTAEGCSSRPDWSS